MSILAGPTFDAFSSTIEASNPFTSSAMPTPFFAVAYRLCLWPFRPRGILQYRTVWNTLHPTESTRTRGFLAHLRTSGSSRVLPERHHSLRYEEMQVPLSLSCERISGDRN